jgi:ferredoxin-thioredoxin reductase catalytic subunit
MPDSLSIIVSMATTIDPSELDFVMKQTAECAERSHFLLNSKYWKSISSAKLRFFGKDNWKMCPCDKGNPDRYCGGPLCAEDVKRDGHCHCNLYLKSES